METTPNKRNWETHISPVTISPCPIISPQRNLTGSLRVAKDIAADVYNNIQRWNDNHILGSNLCNSIVQLKSDSTPNYPDGLEKLTSDLYSVVQTLKGISQALEFLSTQMSALVKHDKTQTPMFFTLNNIQIANLVYTIAEAYKEELKVKEYVSENIAHVRNKSNAMFLCVCWTYQPNISKEINSKLEILLTETGHRNIKPS